MLGIILRNNFPMKISKESPGVISNTPIWVAIEGSYLYTSETFLGLLKILLTERNQDKHLVG